MSKFVLIFSFLIFCFSANSQEVELIFTTNLSSEVDETSGLFLIGDKLWTHNDSGGETKLFQIDTITGAVLRTKFVRGAKNVDWEDVTTDKEYLYIADVGNNVGKRDTLKIYRLAIADFVDDNIDSINSEIISFSYAEDIFLADPKQNRKTNLDCEAIISLADSLYLFSKNWLNNKTYLYSLPKKLGHYTLERLDSLDVSCLITGADFCPETNSLALIGYTHSFQMQPVFILLSNFTANNFFGGDFSRTVLPKNRLQTEAIVFKDKTSFWITNEAFFGQSQALWHLKAQVSSNLMYDNIDEFNIYPNPTNNLLMIECATANKLNYNIFDSVGNLILKSKVKPINNSISIDISNLRSGIYILELGNSNLFYKAKFQKLD